MNLFTTILQCVKGILNNTGIDRKRLDKKDLTLVFVLDVVKDRKGKMAKTVKNVSRKNNANIKKQEINILRKNVYAKVFVVSVVKGHQSQVCIVENQDVHASNVTRNATEKNSKNVLVEIDIKPPKEIILLANSVEKQKVLLFIILMDLVILLEIQMMTSIILLHFAENVILLSHC